MNHHSHCRRIALLGIAVFFTVLLCLLQYRFDNKYQFPGVHGKQGVLDLGCSQDSSGSVPLSLLTYGWEFYPQELISPREFDNRQGGPPHFIYLGQHGGFETGEPGDSPHGFATYRLTILLPDSPAEYALELPEIYTASRVYINGGLASSTGNLDDINRKPATRTGMITFQAAGQAEIVIQAADSRHYYSGITYPPAFGTVEAVSGLLSFRLLRTCLMVFASLTIGLLYLVIGLRIGRDQKRMILFAAVSLLFAVHVMYPLFHLFGAGYWSYRLEDASFYLFLAAVIFLHCNLCSIRGRTNCLAVTVGCVIAILTFLVPSLLLKNSLDAMMIYSAILDGYRLLLFGWLITTALLQTHQRGLPGNLLLAGLCVIAAALFAQLVSPVFEPVRFGWPVENAGFVFILLLAGGLWFDTVQTYAQRAVLEEHVRLMKNQFSLQEENYRIITRHFEETRQLRHDLRHHLHTIQELVRHRQYQDLEDYLTEYGDSTGQDSWPLLCENHAANAVLTYYQQSAKQKQVPFTVNVSLPADLPLEGWKLGVLMGNLLENAIEASVKLPVEQRRVTVYSALSKGSLLIIVKNNWNGDFREQTPAQRISATPVAASTKHEGPGIGLASVRSLVEKSGGQFYFTPGPTEFEVSIVLWNVT